jgi:putative aminopeptidase FrvX
MKTEKETLKYFLDMSLADTTGVFNEFKKIDNHIFREEKNSQRRFLYIEGSKENKVVLVAHADTVWDGEYYYDQTVIERDGFFVGKNQLNTGIGADDRAGCAILWELRNSGHSLLITDGEERGCIGTKWLMNENPDIAERINQHLFMIEFDRRNATDYKTYNVGSQEFHEFIEEETGYTRPNKLSSTDITHLCKKICGVNLSVGYYDEHHSYERINIAEWQNTLAIARKLLSKDLSKVFVLNK